MTRDAMNRRAAARLLLRRRNRTCWPVSIIPGTMSPATLAQLARIATRRGYSEKRRGRHVSAAVWFDFASEMWP